MKMKSIICLLQFNLEFALSTTTSASKCGRIFNIWYYRTPKRFTIRMYFLISIYRNIRKCFRVDLLTINAMYRNRIYKSPLKFVHGSNSNCRVTMQRNIFSVCSHQLTYLLSSPGFEFELCRNWTTWLLFQFAPINLHIHQCAPIYTFTYIL